MRTAAQMPLLGVVAAVLAFAGVMLGWIFLDLGQIAQVNHIDLLTAAATVGDTEAGWGGVLSDPFASPVDWAFFAVAMFVAFRFAAGARLGLARRTAPTRSARSSGALMADEETEPDERDRVQLVLCLVRPHGMSTRQHRSASLPGHGRAARQVGPDGLAPQGSPWAAWILALVAFLVPVLPAIIALVLAARAAGRIRASQGTLAGAGMVTAARVVATGALVLVPVGILVGAGLVASLQQTTGPEGRPSVAATPPGTTATTVTEPAATATTAVSPPPSTVRGRRAHLDSVRAGVCFNLLNKQAESVDTVRVVPCRQAHDDEVFAVVRLPRSPFPGDDRVLDLADEACGAHLKAYTGKTYDELPDNVNYLAYAPIREGWAAGDRRTTCTLVDSSDGQLTGSLRHPGG
jgi:hypothetical protein